MTLECAAEGKETKFRELSSYRQNGVMLRTFSLHILLYHLIAEDFFFFVVVFFNSLFHTKSCCLLFPGILRHFSGNFCRSYRRIYGCILGFSKVIPYPQCLLLLAEFEENWIYFTFLHCLPCICKYVYISIWRFSFTFLIII